MGRLVVVVGNSGVGKTTLVNALTEVAPFAVGREQHAERPFQALMKGNPPRYALANQFDYLLYRAEQERALRQLPVDGLVDGGLDLDFYGFTRLFHRKGYLTDAELSLCERLYRQLRLALGPPDLIIRLEAPLDVIRERYRKRGRTLEIAQTDDLDQMERLLDEWLSREDLPRVITVNADTDEYTRPAALTALLEQIRTELHA